MDISNSEIDRLGERLRLSGPGPGQPSSPSPPDLIMLDTYRRTFEPAYRSVVSAIETELSVATSGRPSKVTDSIVWKLQRQETLRLSQMQDIAGCRLEVDSIAEQDKLVSKLQDLFEQAKSHDRRDRLGDYRAFHLVVPVNGRWVEIQVRTQMQHLWATISETLAAAYRSPELKYGADFPARPDLRRQLKEFSALIAGLESRSPTEAGESRLGAVIDLMVRAVILANEAKRINPE